MREIKSLQELETDRWIFKVGDVFSNPYEASHFKITKIEFEEGESSEDAKIHGYRVHPDNYNLKVEDLDVYDENEWHRVWYFNESWDLETV